MIHAKLAAATVLFALTSTAYAGPITIDLNDWTEEAATSASGNWVIAADGSAVTQTINGNPAIFYSDFDAFARRLAVLSEPIHQAQVVMMTLLVLYWATNPEMR